MTLVLSLSDGRTVHSVVADGDREPESLYEVIGASGELIVRLPTISDVCRYIDAQDG